MKNWYELAPDTGVIEVRGDPDRVICGITANSAEVRKDFLFAALNGTHTNGHRYIGEAIKRGAGTIICETLPDECPSGTLFIRTSDSSLLLGMVASAWFGFPSRNLEVVGVTGTNGKTSIATLLWSLFSRLGYRVGLISTISTIVGEKAEPASHTTPEAIRIHSLLADMVSAGCQYCFMEVSSHAVVQKRISGILFAGGIFTNLTHDHLDYHKTFGEYLSAKKGFFDMLPKNAFALINLDDKNGRVMVQNTRAKVFTYSTRSVADFHGTILENHLEGMLLKVNGQEVWTRFVGKFNASNLLAVYGSALLLHGDGPEIFRLMSNLTPVNGRFELIRSPEGKLAIVDYAHTPDALKNVLSAIAEIRTGNGRVITVVGAGGDRDRTKRPQMALEAVLGSDLVILTSDNPRTEDPEEIIREMAGGVEPEHRQKTLTITNRREAIHAACRLAISGDIILIAGKGHETYQEIKGVKYHFDDKEVIREMFGLE